MNKDWVINIYNSIKDFSDIDKQRELWLGLNEEYASCFEEDINLLYYSFCLEDFINELIKIDEKKQIATELLEFKNMLDGYVKPDNDQEILKDPLWLSIVCKASSIIKKWDISNL